MNTFKVSVGGEGFEFPGADGYPLRRFVVERIVEAEDEAAAAAAALARVAQEWAQGEFAATGVTPRLSVVEMHALGWLARLRARDSGYRFQSR